MQREKIFEMSLNGNSLDVNGGKVFVCLIYITRFWVRSTQRKSGYFESAGPA